MAKYLITASYTVEGAKGLIKEGASGRQTAVQKAVAGLGGTIDAMYFALGDADAYVICDFPDVTSVLALSLAVGASGGARVTTTPLVSVAELDAAAKKSVSYRAPGA